MVRPCPINAAHDTSGFDCGIEPLNVYLQRYARQNQQKDAARTYVVLQGARIIAYYTLVFGNVSWLEAPELHQGLGKYPVPVLLIARLAVDGSAKGKGLGTDLLQDALRRALAASEIAGLRAVIVDAKDDKAKKFYRDRGFHPFCDCSTRLFLTVKELRKSIKS